MKNLFFSVLFLLSFLFCLANINEAAVPCSTVNSKAAACLGFATGKLRSQLLIAALGCMILPKLLKQLMIRRLFANA
ncbi:hypothetical protein NC652_004606 [Populus alba x Populus x berolinensis]|uniref:Uncharacterized protein n=1 Tax=Populus alba x Populus x berolinensis TaxID=444605 RepID=A0AAD6RVA5_9ROSI|nr:hypothetical protein NC651_004636 [Populus alba x Populus x berolinensis]KAJ6967097.1 hypothetical protein NC652_004606 [Populus alba x Populus x berolinensis]KAJ7015301.1 hypothetical protein NC653_004572 [Populus alba x Populus x berolinensis]KAJ7015528.1 hypothetical protein NC653_004738 [Populus alba x Populus x berolinensis]